MTDRPESGRQPERPLRVLVVDDNRDAADSLCLLLRIWGHDCQAAYDGVAGLEAARAAPPDCLVLDINMPGLDGYSLAQRVREEPGLEKVKLVALSAYSDENHLRRTREAGFDFHLVKPADLLELERILTMLNQVLQLASQTEELARQNVALANETKSLLQDVKDDLKEIKQEVKEIKQELQEIKEDEKENQEPPSPDAPPTNQ